MEDKVTITKKELENVLVECIANEIALYRIASEDKNEVCDLHKEIYNINVKLLNHVGSAVIANVIKKVFAKKEEKKNGK